MLKKVEIQIFRPIVSEMSGNMIEGHWLERGEAADTSFLRYIAHLSSNTCKIEVKDRSIEKKKERKTSSHDSSGMDSWQGARMYIRTWVLVSRTYMLKGA